MWPEEVMFLVLFLITAITLFIMLELTFRGFGMVMRREVVMVEIALRGFQWVINMEITTGVIVMIMIMVIGIIAAAGVDEF